MAAEILVGNRQEEPSQHITPGGLEFRIKARQALPQMRGSHVCERFPKLGEFPPALVGIAANAAANDGARVRIERLKWAIGIMAEMPIHECLERAFIGAHFPR
jgi:hypothetical protein